MSTKHTPGPWKAVRAPHGPIDVFDSSERDIVTVYGGGTNGDKEANARLISAAPDLLDVLTRMVDQITDERNADHTLGAFSLGARIMEAREAIAKATGT